MPVVERAFFVRGDKITAIDLRPTGNAGTHHKADTPAPAGAPAIPQ